LSVPVSIQLKEQVAVTTTSSDDIFNVGLGLSGAVSAGAYTAGVLDYFIQTLNAWEQAHNDPGVPQHRVFALDRANPGSRHSR
jgi:hypothetical protein